jgi:hypothetical protein
MRAVHDALAIGDETEPDTVLRGDVFAVLDVPTPQNGALLVPVRILVHEEEASSILFAAENADRLFGRLLCGQDSKTQEGGES